MSTEAIQRIKRSPSPRSDHDVSDAHGENSTQRFQGAVLRAHSERNQVDKRSPAQHDRDKAYRVKTGDTLSSIAQHAHTSLAKLEADNPQIRNPNLIHPGQTVFIPGKTAPQQSAANGPSPQRHNTAVQQAQTERTRIDGLSPEQHGNERAYQVKRGDTLSGIAQRTHQSLAQVEAHNPQIRNPNLIHPGDIVFVPKSPSHGAPHATTPVPQPKPEPTPQQHSAPTPGPVPQQNGTPAPGTPNAPTQTTPTPAPQTHPGPLPSAPQSNCTSQPTQPTQQPYSPPIFAPRIEKLGGGFEFSGKANANPSASVEPYGKISVEVVPNLNVNAKLKYTPRTKVTADGIDPGYKVGPGEATKFSDRVKSIFPEKVTIDTGVVFGRKAEIGRSYEVNFKDGVKVSKSVYFSEKDKANVLVDTKQIKLGKLSPTSIGKAAVEGAKESLAQSGTDAEANGRWQPLKQRVWESVKGAEINISGERAGPVLTNFAGKTTLNDIGTALKPTPSSPFVNLSGFAAGTAGSIGGAWATDKLVGHDISNDSLRKAVDGFGGGMTGLVVDGVVQKTLPKVTANAGKLIEPALTKAASLAEPVMAKAAPVLEKAAPLLEKAAPVLEKAAPAVGVLGKVARVGGPAGAVLAGIPDGIKAYQNFSQGNTEEGWKSVGHAAVKVGCTAAGAALGQALIPIPGVGAVVGGVVGGFIGDKLSSLF